MKTLVAALFMSASAAHAAAPANYHSISVTTLDGIVLAPAR